MKNILEKFACKILSSKNGYIRNDSPYTCDIEKLGEIEDKLMSILENEAKDTFRQFVLTQSQAELKVGIDQFILGYRLGTLLTMEVMNNKDDLLSDS